MGVVGGGLKGGVEGWWFGVVWRACVCSLEDARCWVVRRGFAVVVVQEVGNGGVVSVWRGMFVWERALLGATHGMCFNFR